MSEADDQEAHNKVAVDNVRLVDIAFCFLATKRTAIRPRGMLQLGATQHRNPTFHFKSLITGHAT